MRNSSRKPILRKARRLMDTHSARLASLRSSQMGHTDTTRLMMGRLLRC